MVRTRPRYGTAPTSSTAHPAESESEGEAEDTEEEEEQESEEEEQGEDAQEEKLHATSGRGSAGGDLHARLLRLLEDQATDLTETDVAGDDSLLTRRHGAAGSSRDPLEVFRQWWWQRSIVQDTPTTYWASSAALDELPGAKAQMLEDMAAEKLPVKLPAAHRTFAKTMGWTRQPILNSYALFGAKACQSRKFMNEVNKFVVASSSHSAAMRHLKSAQRARKQKKYTRRKVSAEEDWVAYDIDMAREIAGGRSFDSDECEGRELEGTEEWSEAHQQEEHNQSEHHGDEEIDDTRGSHDDRNEAPSNGLSQRRAFSPGVPETDQQGSTSRRRSRTGSRTGSFAFTRTRSRPGAVPKTTRSRNDGDGDVEWETTSVEDSVEQGRGTGGAGYAPDQDLPSELEMSDGQWSDAIDPSPGAVRSPRNTAPSLGGIHVSDVASVSLPLINLHSATQLIEPSAVQQHHTTHRDNTTHRDMSLKRKSPELPDDELSPKRRRLLGDLLHGAASPGFMDNDILNMWLTAISVAEHGTDEGVGLKIIRRSVDDACAITPGIRTCVLFVRKGQEQAGKGQEQADLVACAYVDNRSGIPESRIYVSDRTAIVAETIEQVVRVGENDQIEELPFTPTTCTPYSVVVAATCLCMHRPFPNAIAAFPPIWSHAMKTFSASSTTLDTSGALATVNDVLPPATAVVSAVPDVGNTKQGGRLSTSYLSNLHRSQRQAKLVREALDVKTALATTLLADAALIACLTSIALGRLGPENQSSNIEEKIDALQASLDEQRKCPQTVVTRATIGAVERELKELKEKRIEIPGQRRLELVQQHMHYLAGYLAARRMEYEQEGLLYRPI